VFVCSALTTSAGRERDETMTGSSDDAQAQPIREKDANPRLVGTVVAGFPSPAEQYVEPQLDLNALLVSRPAATFFVRVAGDSMDGAGILDGDLLVVDRSLRPASGDIIIAAVDGEFTVKRFRSDAKGVRLEPENPAYPVLHLRPGQEMDYFGKVIGVVRKLR